MVEEEYSFLNKEHFQDFPFALKASNPSKKVAYQQLLTKYKAVVKILVKIKAIPNKDALIYSVIHKKYHKTSRKWEFTRYVLLYTFS